MTRPRLRNSRVLAMASTVLLFTLAACGNQNPPEPQRASTFTVNGETIENAYVSCSTSGGETFVKISDRSALDFARDAQKLRLWERNGEIGSIQLGEPRDIAYWGMWMWGTPPTVSVTGDVWQVSATLTSYPDVTHTVEATIDCNEREIESDERRYQTHEDHVFEHPAWKLPQDNPLDHLTDSENHLVVGGDAAHDIEVRTCNAASEHPGFVDIEATLNGERTRIQWVFGDDEKIDWFRIAPATSTSKMDNFLNWTHVDSPQPSAAWDGTRSIVNGSFHKWDAQARALETTVVELSVTCPVESAG